MTTGLNDIHYNRAEAEQYERWVKETDKTHPWIVVMHTMIKELAPLDCEQVQNMLGQNVLVSADYCRYSTVRLLLNEIQNGNVPGDLAELGVFRGDFSKIINGYLPDRRLHLFDTFEGFTDTDVETDLSNGFTPQSDFDRWNNFSDTSLPLVMGKMPHPEMCVAHQGYFPDTVPSEEIQYAFVSLDCDLYNPMLAGLRYFYPRLSDGGYIMIHDYNRQNDLKGVGKAVKDYEQETDLYLRKVPLSDHCGSVVICK